MELKKKDEKGKKMREFSLSFRYLAKISEKNDDEKTRNDSIFSRLCLLFQAPQAIRSFPIQIFLFQFISGLFCTFFSRFFSYTHSLPLIHSWPEAHVVSYFLVDRKRRGFVHCLQNFKIVHFSWFSPSTKLFRCIAFFRFLFIFFFHSFFTPRRCSRFVFSWNFIIACLLKCILIVCCHYRIVSQHKFGFMCCKLSNSMLKIWRSKNVCVTLDVTVCPCLVSESAIEKESKNETEINGLTT